MVRTSLTDRPSRSSFHTTRLSAAWGRRWSIAAVTPGRWLLWVETSHLRRPRRTSALAEAINGLYKNSADECGGAAS